MPELPEVQTIIDDLNKKIKGYEIVDFWSDWKKIIKLPFAKFKREIIGCKIKQVKRRGKNILVFLDCKDARKNKSQCCRDATCRVSIEKVMLIHLKMTGHLLVKSEKPARNASHNEVGGLKSGKGNDYFNERVNQYIHHVWTLKKGRSVKTMEFSDLRKFGKIKLIKKEDLKDEKDLKNLGIEPLSAKFTPQRLGEIFEGRKSANIRAVLMDQSLISGIGNIYVSEILFDAKISSKRKVGKITKKEVKKLHGSIKKVLKKAVKLRGTSDSDYRDTSGAPGGFQKILKVYNREGQKCKRKNCKGIIKREKINQRSAYFCDECQK
jgi:formamidopyrimidine-DNA glycosylase